jgi:glycosyltransferase involved in cell wall biosynthesis
LVPPLLNGFVPDAVLTVAHGHLWVTAAEFARRYRLPLHLIVHDDWPHVARLPPPFGGRVDGQFSAVYRAAASRLCVSPFMAAEYKRRYGVEGQVFYPAGARDAKTFAAPPERLKDVGHGMVFAFAGTINTPDYYRLLRTLAECLEPLGGRVLIFGPLTAVEATSVGLNKSNVQLCGLLKSSDLIERLRGDVDALFVPMSFAALDRPNMEVSFPSKLVDYTAVGLPLLIMGPPYCSAVRWAYENPGVAEIVDSDDGDLLSIAIQRLAEDADHRMNLAAAALSGCSRFFSHGSAQSRFLTALQSRAA